jgi:hypothetical protein
VDFPWHSGRLPSPLAPEGLADAPASAPAHSPFFRLAWHSFDRAERDAEARELARAEEGFLIATHSFGLAGQPWLEGLAMLALAAVYRLGGFDLPDWLVGRTMALTLEPEVVEHLLDFLLLIEITPPDSPHLLCIISDIRSHRIHGRASS